MSIWKDLGRRVGDIRQNMKSPELPAAVKKLPLPRAAVKGLPPRKKKYEYIEPEPSVLLNQRAVWDRIKGGESPEEALEASVSVLKMRHAPRISVIVATYEPVVRYFERTLISILSQTYGGFELIIADTSLSGAVRDLLDHYRDERIRYYSVPGNRGEASLINDAAHMASGDYVCTVDVGDQLTKDALYEVFLYIMRTGAEILYTDEDHCDASGKRFDQPNYKPDFNKDYLLSNNYMRRLLVIRRELFLALRLRDAFDGALTYDLVLRAPKSEVCHVPHILYHVSSASSDSKNAAREPDAVIAAGKAALEDYFRERRMRVQVNYSSRKGTYRVIYHPDIFTCRNEVGVVGGRVLSRTHKVVGGMFDSAGRVMYEGWDEAEGGPMNRAMTVQNAYAVDARCMRVRPELRGLYEEIFGKPSEAQYFDWDKEPQELKRRSILFCRRIRELGYLIVWDPSFITVV
ncbi:MAG: glycosyltransferase [Lachnospiraceae bacterium]|nr:glycosyltransferase [Lachnospiraceae bacterium]